MQFDPAQMDRGFDGAKHDVKRYKIQCYKHIKVSLFTMESLIQIHEFWPESAVILTVKTVALFCDL